MPFATFSSRADERRDENDDERRERHRCRRRHHHHRRRDSFLSAEVSEALYRRRNWSGDAAAFQSASKSARAHFSWRYFVAFPVRASAMTPMECREW